MENQEWVTQSYCEGTCLAFFLFLVYLEMNPKIGGILVRPGSDGEDHFSFEGMIPILTTPFSVRIVCWFFLTVSSHIDGKSNRRTIRQVAFPVTRQLFVER